MAGIRQLTTRKTISSSNKALTNQDQWLLDLFDEYLTEEQHPSRPWCFFPSLLGSVCDKNLYLAYRGMLSPSTIYSYTRRIFDNGSYLEDRMNSYFEKMGIVKDRELPLKCDDPPISGRADFLLSHPLYDEVLLELKSINDKGFKNLRGKPKKEHMVQIQIYLHLADMDHGIVLYENKNDQHIKAFAVDRDPKMWDTIQKRCKKIQELEIMPESSTGPPWCPCKDYKEVEEEYDGEMESYESIGESE